MAVQAVVASWLAAFATVTLMLIEAGLLINSVTVQVALVVDVLDELQKPAVLALAAVMPAVIAPAASKPVKAARTIARHDRCIINCLSAFALSPSPDSKTH